MSLITEDNSWKYSSVLNNKNYNFNKDKILKILSKNDIDEAYNIISLWDGYISTPLISLNKLSKELKLNKIFYKDESKRFGLKSFRVKCWEILPQIDGLACSTHPHNYYLELLSETGLVGTITILIFFIILLIKSLDFLSKKNYKTKSEKYLIIPMLIIFILEIWPLKSSGSFFTTGIATFIWLLIGMIFATTQKNTLIK